MRPEAVTPLCYPAFNGSIVLGMISIRDIIDDIIADHETLIAHLESCIRSRPA